MELPRVQVLYDKLKSRGFEVVAVEATRNRKTSEEFVQNNKLGFTCLENGTGDLNVVSGKVGVRVFPTSFLIDRKGNIVRCHVGFEPGDEVKLEKEILELL